MMVNPLYHFALAVLMQLPLTVSFAWDANPITDSVTEYRLYCGPTSGGPYTLLETVPGDTTTATAVFQAPAALQYCVVTAVNSIGESGYSNEAVNVPLPSQSPGNPTGLNPESAVFQ